MTIARFVVANFKAAQDSFRSEVQISGSICLGFMGLAHHPRYSGPSRFWPNCGNI